MLAVFRITRLVQSGWNSLWHPKAKKDLLASGPCQRRLLKSNTVSRLACEPQGKSSCRPRRRPPSRPRNPLPGKGAGYHHARASGRHLVGQPKKQAEAVLGDLVMLTTRRQNPADRPRHSPGAKACDRHAALSRTPSVWQPSAQRSREHPKDGMTDGPPASQHHRVSDPGGDLHGPIGSLLTARQRRRFSVAGFPVL